MSPHRFFPVSHKTWFTHAALALPTSRTARKITRRRYTTFFDRSSQRSERRADTIPCPRERGSSRTPPCKQECPEVYPQPSKKNQSRNFLIRPCILIISTNKEIVSLSITNLTHNSVCRRSAIPRNVIIWVSAFFKFLVPFENASTAQKLLNEGSSQHFKCLRNISSKFQTKFEAHALLLLFRHPARHEK